MQTSVSQEFEKIIGKNKAITLIVMYVQHVDIILHKLLGRLKPVRLTYSPMFNLSPLHVFSIQMVNSLSRRCISIPQVSGLKCTWEEQQLSISIIGGMHITGISIDQKPTLIQVLFGSSIDHVNFRTLPDLCDEKHLHGFRFVQNKLVGGLIIPSLDWHFQHINKSVKFGLLTSTQPNITFSFFSTPVKSAETQERVHTHWKTTCPTQVTKELAQARKKPI